MDKNNNEQREVTVFTDGSSRGNPGPGGWGAVIIFLPESENEKYVVELGGGERNTTNNRMELKAVIEAIKYILENLSKDRDHRITVYTDSGYLIKGITGWIRSWERNGWIKKGGSAVKNEDLWKELGKLSKQINATWKHVRGHAGVAGNERADEIACRFADGEDFPLRKCAYSEYDKDILSLEQNNDKSLSKEKKKTFSRKPYSYVSEVRGKVASHGTWGECKKRVEGVSGARFKKAYSPDEEKNLMDNWSY
ncbi:MAG: ribonuclease HI [Patescibacteria group bacterium]